MKRIGSVLFAVCALMLVSCGQRPLAGPEEPRLAPGAIEGTVTQISGGHGNAYTSIRPEQYESLGLVAGRLIRVAFNDTALTLEIGQDYTDVPSGTPLAVLHREGLTFAIRDGNFSRTYGIEVGDTFRVQPARRGE